MYSIWAVVSPALGVGDIATLVSVLVWFAVVREPNTLIRTYVVPITLMAQAGVVKGIVNDHSAGKGFVYGLLGVVGLTPLLLVANALGQRRPAKTGSKR
jgi:hypothetical protein